MSRVITSMHFDLGMIVRPGWSPPCTVTFTDIAADGHESHGDVTFIDAAAQRIWDAADKIAAVLSELAAREQALPDLPTIAARMTAVDDLDRQEREKVATADALDAQIAAKQAALAVADAQLAVRATALAAEAPAPVAAAGPA